MINDPLSSFRRKSFQSLEQLSADMSLSQTSLEPSHTLSLEARPGPHWPHQGTSPPDVQEGFHFVCLLLGHF